MIIVIVLKILKIYEVILLHEIEVRKNGVTYCVYADESVLPDKEAMKNIRAAGYKFYQDGKLYKPEKK